MGKGRSGHKPNNANKKSRALYKLRDRRSFNKDRKVKKEFKKNLKLALEGKGIYKDSPPDHSLFPPKKDFISYKSGFALYRGDESTYLVVDMKTLETAVVEKKNEE